MTSALCAACADLPERLILVIDDYYVITNETVHEIMAALIRTWSERVHVIIVTRTYPPLKLPQLRVRGQLAEVLARDLQFSRAEMETFVRAALDAVMPAALLDTLHQRTEGWAAGVRMAVLSLEQRDGPEGFIHEFERNSNRYIMDYLADEALRGQAPDVQAFLLRTAVLARMCSGLCATLSDALDERRCQAILEQLEQRNLFIVNLDDHRGWYRYHHQFQALLLNQLHRAVGDAGVEELRCRAAAWLAANGYLDDALAEYAALGKHDLAAQLVEDNLVLLQNDEQWLRLTRWLSHLPEPVVGRRPGLLIALGWTKRIQHADHEIVGLVARAEELLLAPEASEAERVRWEPQLLALKTAFGVITDPAVRIDVASRARRAAPSDQIWVRAFAQMNEVFACQIAADFERASRVVSEALEDPGFRSGKSLARLHLTGAASAFFEGALSSTLWHAERCEEFAAQHRMPLTASWGHCLQGLVHFERNDLTQAERCFRLVVDSHAVTNWQASSLSAYHLMRILAGRGDLAATGVVLESRRLLEAQVDQPDPRVSNALAARLALFRGDLGDAFAWAHARADAIGENKSVLLNDPEWPILVDVLLAQGSAASLIRAESVLDAVLAYSEGVNDRRSWHEAQVWLARVRAAQDRCDAALDALATAAAFAQPRGCVRWFIEGGPLVQDLLVDLVRGRRSAAASELLARVRHAHRAPRHAPSNAIDGENLSPREVEVLELLAAKLTNKEIAAKLGISPLTVRNHTSRIYEKLHVTRRRQAVRLAQSRGLIS